MIQTPQTSSRSPFQAAVITCLLSITFHMVVWTAWQAMPIDPPKPIIPPPEVIEVALMKASANKPAPPAMPQVAKPIVKPKELPKPQKLKTLEKPKNQPKVKSKVESKPVAKPKTIEKVVDTPSPTPTPVQQAPVTNANSATSGTATPAPVKSVAPAPETFEKAGYNSANLNNPPTRYPAIARQRRWVGTVLLEVHVLANGSPSEVKVVKSSGHELLDDAAVEQLKTWSFTPARRGNKTVDDWVRVPMTFKLKD